MAEYSTLPFAEQIAFFRQKVNVPTVAWTDVYGAEHDQAFMVAGAFKADLLADLRGLVDQVQSQGMLFTDFKRDFAAIAQARGWPIKGDIGRRARIVYETNLYQSYNAGREAQMASPELRKRRPYGLYVHRPSPNERPEHKAHHNRVVPLDDPWWKVWSPMNGWGCKCKKFMLSEADVQRRGLTVTKGPPIEYREVLVGKNSPTQRTVQVPKGIDPGFEYRPGDTRLGQMAQRLIEKTAGLPASVAALAVAPLIMRERVLASLTASFGEWMDRLPQGKPTGVRFPVGVMAPRVLDALAQRGVDAATAAISISDREIAHMLRAAKQAAGKALAEADVRQLPRVLAAPKAVLFDRQEPALLYVFDPQDQEGRAGKFVVRVNYTARVPGASGKGLFNSVGTGGLVPRTNLADPARYEVLSGEV